MGGLEPSQLCSVAWTFTPSHASAEPASPCTLISSLSRNHGHTLHHERAHGPSSSDESVIRPASPSTLISSLLRASATTACIRRGTGAALHISCSCTHQQRRDAACSSHTIGREGVASPSLCEVLRAQLYEVLAQNSEPPTWLTRGRRPPQKSAALPRSSRRCAHPAWTAAPRRAKCPTATSGPTAKRLSCGLFRMAAGDDRAMLDRK